MKHRTTLYLATIAFVLATAQVAMASALDEFADAWSKVDNYSCSINVHETLAKDVQDRRYDFWFKKPTLAKIEIVSGPGRGSGSVWHGGDTVKGHQGGILSGIKMNVSLHDKRAVSLRGDTMDSASFGHILSVFESGKANVTEAAGETIDGAATTALTLKVANPGANNNVTRDVVYLSKTTHLPVRRARYEGDALVKQEDFVNVKLNPGLKESDF
jgi:outer membrane lipoprotein-sorting protein